MPTYQEILEGICRHKAEPLRINRPGSVVVAVDLERKIGEIEWALQALAEKLVAKDES